jgi:hypothetical protein
MDKLASKNISYWFGKIDQSTDQMISEFNELLTVKKHTKISVISVADVARIIPAVTTSVSASITASMFAIQMGTAKKRTLKDFTIDEIIPDWSTIAGFILKFYFIVKFIKKIIKFILSLKKFKKNYFIIKFI